MYHTLALAPDGSVCGWKTGSSYNRVDGTSAKISGLNEVVSISVPCCR